jgi:hypothetical protein
LLLLNSGLFSLLSTSLLFLLLWWLSGGGGGGLFRDATERCKEGRLRDFFGDGCRCWMLFFGDGCRWCWLIFFGGTFGGLDTVVNVGGDFRPSPSGKLTVLKSTKNRL